MINKLRGCNGAYYMSSNSYYFAGKDELKFLTLKKIL